MTGRQCFVSRETIKTNRIYPNKFICIFVFLLLLACIGYFFIKSKGVIVDKTTAVTAHEALFYSRLSDNDIKCNLCFRNCLLPEGKAGFCFNRINLKGKLYSQGYAQPCIIHVTPVEKEPVVSFEYMLDTFKLASKRGLKTVFHTNGSINPEPLKTLLEYTDAVIVDLKGFSNDFYDNICSARLGPVLHTMKIISEEEAPLEVVNLIIPAFNDDLERIEVMFNWLGKNLGRDTSLHFSSFSPSHKMKNLPPASQKTLEEAAGTARKCRLKHVYINNFPELKHNSTTCPHCKRTLIKRDSLGVTGNSIRNGKCRYCGKRIPGIMEIKNNC